MAKTDWGQEVESGVVLIKNETEVISVGVDWGNMCELAMVKAEMHPDDQWAVKHFDNGMVIES